MSTRSHPLQTAEGLCSNNSPLLHQIFVFSPKTHSLQYTNVLCFFHHNETFSSVTLPPRLSLFASCTVKYSEKVCYVVSSIPYLPFSLKLPLVYFFILTLSYNALFEVIDDFLTAQSKGRFLLVLAAALDTVDHAHPPPWNTFFTCLFSHSSFSWFSAYLTHHSFSVSLAGFSSHQLCNVNCHRAQSSVLLFLSTLSLW